MTSASFVAFSCILVMLLGGIKLVILEIFACQAILCLSKADVTISGDMAIMLFTAFYAVLLYMVRWYLENM